MSTKNTTLLVTFSKDDETVTKSYVVTNTAMTSDTAIQAVSGIKSHTTATIDNVKLTDTYDLGGVE